MYLQNAENNLLMDINVLLGLDVTIMQHPQVSIDRLLDFSPERSTAAAAAADDDDDDDDDAVINR